MLGFVVSVYYENILYVILQNSAQMMLGRSFISRNEAFDEESKHGRMKTSQLLEMWGVLRIKKDEVMTTMQKVKARR